MEKFAWGSDPNFSGPRDWFRNSLIIKELVKKKSRGRVLDFGCGSGNLLVRLLQKGYNCLGVDSSAMAVSFLQKRLIGSDLKGQVALVKSTEKLLPASKEKFDAVILGEVLEHLINDQLVVNKIYCVLKKSGICIVSVPAHTSLWDISDNYAGHIRRYEAAQLKTLFEQAGFKVERVYYWGFPLSRIWHKRIFLPLFMKSIKNKKPYTDSQGLLGVLLGQVWLKQIFSCVFYIDQLCNWTKKGNGLILVASK